MNPMVNLNPQKHHQKQTKNSSSFFTYPLKTMLPFLIEKILGNRSLAHHSLSATLSIDWTWFCWCKHSLKTHAEKKGPWTKSLNGYFSYQICNPKSLKVSHWLSKNTKIAPRKVVSQASSFRGEMIRRSIKLIFAGDTRLCGYNLSRDFGNLPSTNPKQKTIDVATWNMEELTFPLWTRSFSQIFILYILDSRHFTTI